MDSQLNRNSIYLDVKGQRFGYLPATAAQALGPELDSGRSASATVDELLDGEEEPIGLRLVIAATET